MHMRAKLCPGGSKANRAYVAPDTRVGRRQRVRRRAGDDSERELLASLACDAQTSGGLLLCVPADRRRTRCVARCAMPGLPAARIGSLTARAAQPAITLD